MGAMTDQEARSWCTQRGIPVAREGPETSQLGSGIFFSIPDDCAGRVRLAQLMYPSTFEVPGKVLLWLPVAVSWTLSASISALP